MPASALPRQSILEWKNVVFDIQRPKAERAKRKKGTQAQDVEKLPADEASSSVADDAAANVDADVADNGTAPVDVDHRRILCGVGGTIYRGQMMAILGASGAGKTTLLNILSGRMSKQGSVSGDILFEGKEREQAKWKKSVGFVEQDDLMLPLLTVYEMLYYSSCLRLPDKTHSRQEKEERVETILQMLRLDACRDTKIGSSASRGVSGGERKRTSIGAEMVSNVPLLFMDEPTSGLDAHAAGALVKNLGAIVKDKNIACLMTIHQPSWAMIQLYDTIQLLARGRVYYQGPPQEMIPWFDSLGFDVPEGCNPADHYISLAENPGKSREGEKRIVSMIKKWHHNQTRDSPPAEAGTPHMSESQKSETEFTTHDQHLGGASMEPRNEIIPAGWPTSWPTEFILLSKRNFAQLTRDKGTLSAMAGQTTILLILIGFAFFRLGNSQQDVLARIGILFFLCINTIFTVLLPVLGPLAMQRALMRRERLAGMYRTTSFYASKVLLDTTSNVLLRLPFVIVLYWMVGLRTTASAFFIYLAVNVTLVVVAVSMGLFVGSVSPSIEIANLVAPLFTVIFLLFGGNLLPNPPPWFVWLRWISPITYAYMALAQNEFRGQTFTCHAVQSQCYQTGEQVLQQYNLHTFTIAECIGFLFAIASLFIVLGYLSLRITVHPRLRLQLK